MGEFWSWEKETVVANCGRYSGPRQTRQTNYPCTIMNRNKASVFFWLMLASAGMTGCATTAESRLEKNAAVVATWPPEVQSKVRAGEAAVGFSTEQVRVALGEPDWITTLTDARGVREVWSYAGRKARFGIGLGVGVGSGYGGVSVAGGGRRGQELRRVIFESGRVVEIEQVKPR
jgi:hypothetical protein